MARRYEQGESAYHIARSLGLKKDHAVRSAIKRAGARMRPSTHERLGDEDVSRMAERYEEGASISHDSQGIRGRAHNGTESS